MPTKLGLSITSAPQAGHRQKSVVLQCPFQQHTFQAAVRHQRLSPPGVEAPLAASEAPKGASDHQDELAEPDMVLRNCHLLTWSKLKPKQLRG